MEMKGVMALRNAMVAGTLSPQAYVAACYEKAVAVQQTLQPFSWLPASAPLPATDLSLPLAGIPVGVKDLMDTADMPTTYGSPLYAAHRPQRDAAVVARLRALGATMLGKTVTTEFAWRHAGPTRNPHGPAHTPGGSSSGSAAAVAAGIVPLALGTQTYGSIIRPAAYCGITGFKPTFGSIVRSGVFPLAGSLDHVGVFTHRVSDAAYVYSLLAGVDEADPHGMPPVPFDFSSFRPARPRRIGVLHGGRWDAVDAAQAQAMAHAAQQWRAQGVDVVPVTLPAPFDALWDTVWTILCVEAAEIHREHRSRQPVGLSPVMCELVDQGEAMHAPDYVAALRRQSALRTAFDAWLAENDIDVLMTAPAPGEAPEGLAFTGDGTWCAPFTLLGVPAITFRIGTGPHGLPLGVQLIAARGHDKALLQAAAWCQSTAGYGSEEERG